MSRMVLQGRKTCAYACSSTGCEFDFARGQSLVRLSDEILVGHSTFHVLVSFYYIRRS